MLVDIAKDALQARTTFDWPRQVDLPGYRPATKPHGKQVREAARLIVDGASGRCSTSAAACIKARATAELQAAGRADRASRSSPR